MVDQGVGTINGHIKAVQVHRAEPGCQLTAFYAESNWGSFHNFATRSQAVKNLLQYPLSESSGVSHDIPITQKTLETAQEVLGSPGGFAFAAANLSNLKRVGVSVGDEGSADIHGHISGLRLEYHDSDIPVVLGQWIRLLDAFDVSPSDRITEMTTWHNYEIQDRRKKCRLIRKLRLVTILGTTKDFLDPCVSGKVCLKYRENPYQKLVSQSLRSSPEMTCVPLTSE